MSVSVWSVLTISPRVSGVNNAHPTHPPSLSLASHPGCPAYTRVMRWWSRTLPASGLRHPVLVRATRLSHASSVSPRVMRETRPGPGDAVPCVWSPSSASILPGKAGRGARRGRTHRSLLQLPPGPDPSNGEWRRKTPVNSGHRARDYDNERH